MRGLIAIILLVGGIASGVYGAAQLTGVVDGSGVGMMIGGLIATIIGASTIRRMSGSRADAPIRSSSALGDHSLTEHHTGSPSHAPTGTPTASSTEPRGTASGRRGIVVFSLLAIAGGVAGFIGTLESDPPNVATQILTACEEALREAEGPGASFGRVVEYQSVGLTFQEVSFETTQGWTWTCSYSTDTGQATASQVDRG